jgi:predicted nucleotidyltransferase
MMDRAVAKNRELVRRTAPRHRAGNVRIFGSRARGGARPNSDLHLIVEFKAGRTLLDAIGLELAPGYSLGCSTQALTPTGPAPQLRDKILGTAVAL